MYVLSFSIEKLVGQVGVNALLETFLQAGKGFHKCWNETSGTSVSFSIEKLIGQVGVKAHRETTPSLI